MPKEQPFVLKKGPDEPSTDYEGHDIQYDEARNKKRIKGNDKADQ